MAKKRGKGSAGKGRRKGAERKLQVPPSGLGDTQVNGNREAPPRVSCCIIARNEARNLADCLTSLAPLGESHEVVLVDTGSEDGTPALAESLGARVFHQPWRDDFSAPRNLAADHARGQWVLLLDADERLTVAGARALISAIDEDDFDCGLLPLFNADRLDARREDVVAGRATLGAAQLLPRLFRNVDGLAWEGIVHERPSAWFARATRRIKPLPSVPIAHYGAVPELRTSLAKEERNLSLLEKQVALTPDDYRIREYLAYGLRDAGQTERSAQEIERVFDRVCQVLRAGECSPRPSIVACATLHANLLREAGNVVSALAAVDEAISLSQGTDEACHPNLHFQRGACLELLALQTSGSVRDSHIADATRAYEICLGKRGVMYVAQINPPGCVAELGEKRLGSLALMASDGATATRWFTRASEATPDDPEVTLGLSESAYLLGDLNGCLKAIKPLMAMPQADALTLAALCCEAGNSARMCRDLALMALRAFKAHGALAPHRRILLTGLAQRLQGREAS